MSDRKHIPTMHQENKVLEKHLKSWFLFNFRFFLMFHFNSRPCLYIRPIFLIIKYKLAIMFWYIGFDDVVDSSMMVTHYKLISKKYRKLQFNDILIDEHLWPPIFSLGLSKTRLLRFTNWHQSAQLIPLNCKFRYCFGLSEFGILTYGFSKHRMK